MNLESQWKDPKKLNRNIVIGLVVAVIIVHGYYNCWFDGPHAYWNLNWGPGYCENGGSPENCGGSSGGNACGSCPSGEPCNCENTKCPDCVPPTYTCGSEDDAMCGGSCPEGYQCEYGVGDCVCAPVGQPCGWHSDGGMVILSSFTPEPGACYGDCPYGQVCYENRQTGACECIFAPV